jgi:ATP-dependent DNA helicase RecG
VKYIQESIESLLHAKENEHLEFKEAKNRFDFEELVKYCCALANEGGGKMVLGITNQRPRMVVGSRAFENLERTKAGLIDRLRLRIEVEEFIHQDGPVVIFKVPPRPLGMPIQYQGSYWMRAGEDLVPMTQDMLRGIFDEVGADFSAEICSNAVLTDLDPAAIAKFRAMWQRKSGNSAISSLSEQQLLTDVELIIDGGITVAALILLGTRNALGKFLPQAEVVFEYRSSDVSGPAQQREEFREGLFLFEDKLMKLIDVRNDKQHYQDGLFVWDISTFNETVIREVILNAVSHRAYRLPGSVFIRQYPRKLEVVSPGGFPSGITVENILWRQAPRNRRIAEVLARCGMVERSGQGINRMYEECIKESKPKPDFAGTDEYQVAVTIRGEIQDIQFLRFLEKVGQERLSSFSTEDLLVLDRVHREQPIPEMLRSRLPLLVEHGVIERLGRRRYILSRKFYTFLGKKGVYTRKRGLDRDTNKELLQKHIQENRVEGSRLRDLMDVLPSLTRSQVQGLLRTLKKEGRAHSVGPTRSALWYPGIESH